MLDLKKRYIIEFLYLLCSRCFLNMSFVLNDFVDINNPVVENLKKSVKIMYRDVSKKFE